MSTLCDLTISLIVKNEAKTLASCLHALSPLRNALSCQLIVTDTGSTDGTQEIAKEYADLFLEFEWCNDFSKARNHAIPHATGRWFFYLDADERCDETILEIASFLTSPHSHTIDAASVAQRNYRGQTQDLSQYSDCICPRLVNFQQGTRYFQYAIHETIPVTGTLTPLPVILHHSGYLDENNQAKEGRNATLLKEEIAKNPLELKHYIPLIREMKEQTEEKQWIDRAFSVVERCPEGKNHFAFSALLIELARHGLTYHQVDLMDQSLTFLASSHPNSYPYLEVLGMKLELLLHEKRPLEEVLPLFVAYRNLHGHLIQHPDTTHLIASVYLLHTPFAYYHFELRVVHALLGSTVLEGGGTLLNASKAYQYVDENGNYPYWKKATILGCQLGLTAKLEEMLLFYNEKNETVATECAQIIQHYLQEKGRTSL